MTYTFRHFQIRDDMLVAIRSYTQMHIQPGDFLAAVICNNLCEACGRADDDNLANLPAFVAYFYNEVPAACWGSRKKMLAWLTNEELKEAS